MMNITVEVKGKPELMRRLKQAGVDVSDMRAELKDVGGYLKDFYTRDVFDTRGQVINAEWAPLNLKYRQYKQKKAPGKGPLEFTGTMRDSFYSKLGKNQVEVGNMVDYFKYHQLGTRTIPARRMIKLDYARKEKIVDIFEGGLKKRLAKAWR